MGGPASAVPKQYCNGDLQTHAILLVGLFCPGKLDIQRRMKCTTAGRRGLPVFGASLGNQIDAISEDVAETSELGGQGVPAMSSSEDCNHLGQQASFTPCHP